MPKVSQALYTLSVCLIVLLLLTAAFGTLLAFTGQNAGYAQLFEQYADTAASGVASDQYPTLADGLSAYLQGRVSSPQVNILACGDVRPAYSEKELVHLGDVRTLLNAFAQCRLMVLPAASLILLLALCVHRSRRLSHVSAWRHAFGRCVLGGLGLALLLPAAVVVWAVCDFNAAFTLAHRLVFQNDLWLLNPATDLLIQLMPLPLFIHLGYVLFLRLLPVLAGLTGGAALLAHHYIRPKASGAKHELP